MPAAQPRQKPTQAENTIPVRVAVLADCHLDYMSPYGRNGSHAWLRACDFVARERIPVAVIAGDLFHTGYQPADDTLRTAQIGVRLMQENGTYVVLLAGNHEWLGLHGKQTICPVLEQLRTHDSRTVKVVVKPEIIDVPTIPNLKLAMLPWPRPSASFKAASVAETLSESLESHAGPRLCIAHASVSEAIVNVQDGEQRIAGSIEPCQYGLNEIDLTGFGHVALGHYHLRQSLSDTCGYIGCIDQLDFRDEGTHKGFSVFSWDIKARRWHEKFVKVGVNRFKTVVLGKRLPEFSPGDVVRVKAAEDYNKDDLLSAIARIRSCNAELAKVIVGTASD